MRCRLTGAATLLIATLLLLTPAHAEIAWNYEKPSSERSVGNLLSDILGLSEFGKDYAVIIGLHRFEDFNPLDATENDPQRVFEFLRDEAGFDYILMLRDDEVTYQKLRSLFEFELPRVLRSNDRFLLYWSGHGTQFPDARGVELGYLPLISSRADDKSTMVAMRDFARWDNELLAKHALFLLDACFSGLAGSTAQSDERDLEIRELTKPGHHIISAGGRDQQTLASLQEWQGSIFADALLKALRGHADRYGGAGKGDGVINLYELVADIGETVKNAKAAAGWKRPLRPVLNVFRGEGQFFFLTNERKRAYLAAQGKQVSDELAYGMPVVVMSAAEKPADLGPEPPANNLDQDFQVWSVVQDSSNPIDLRTFIDTFPDSVWVPFARNRLAMLGPSDSFEESAALVSSSEEAEPSQGTTDQQFTVEPVDVKMVVRNDAINVRSGPGTEFPVISQANRGMQVEVTGRDEGRDWYRVRLPDGSEGYVFTGLLGAVPEPLNPGTVFRDCPRCPEMVVVPAGKFMMGSPRDEPGHNDAEAPRQMVSIPRPFAVGRYEVTFAEWDACVAGGGCRQRPYDMGWGRDDRPVMNVSWNDAKEYVRWLSRKIYKSYRLLSEAEWEYVARAGSRTSYWWGEDVGRGNADCDGCGSQWDKKGTAPVGSFDANAFGLHDTAGNVWEWTEDCWKEGYDGMSKNGSPWLEGDCSRRVLRGGSWYGGVGFARSAYRSKYFPDGRNHSNGFRVARAIE